MFETGQSGPVLFFFSLLFVITFIAMAFFPTVILCLYYTAYRPNLIKTCICHPVIIIDPTVGEA